MPLEVTAEAAAVAHPVAHTEVLALPVMEAPAPLEPRPEVTAVEWEALVDTVQVVVRWCKPPFKAVTRSSSAMFHPVAKFSPPPSKSVPTQCH